MAARRHILLSAETWREHGRIIAQGVPFHPVIVDGAGPPENCDKVEAAFLARDVFAGGTRDRLSPGFIGFVECLCAAPALKWLHIFSAGADLWVYRELEARGVRITTSAGASATTVAHSAIAGLLALARQLPRCADAQRRRAWQPLYGRGEPRALPGQTAVIVGTGPIGQEIARLCRALRLITIGIRRNASPVPEFDEIEAFGAFHHVLPRADWLILACPLSPVTRGLVDAKAFALLPAGARMVNVARGAVIEEDALIAALRTGGLGGAFLDVFATEPLPPESGLWDLPGVIVTPHSAAASDGHATASARMFADNLKRWCESAPMLNEVTAVA